MPNIREIATKCLWLAATALTGFLGLAIGVLLTPLALILYPIGLCIAYWCAKAEGGDPTPLHLLTLRKSFFMFFSTVSLITSFPITLPIGLTAGLIGGLTGGFTPVSRNP